MKPEFGGPAFFQFQSFNTQDKDFVIAGLSVGCINQCNKLLTSGWEFNTLTHNMLKYKKNFLGWEGLPSFLVERVPGAI